MARRLAFLVEEYLLLRYNHFGGLKQKTTVDALLVLQEKIYQAWKEKKILWLIMFDVKGAFSGVASDTLIDRPQKRRIPEQMVSWIKSFCENRKATVTVNGGKSKITALDQEGLPQSLPLSPIVYLFFNSDLVQGVINTSKGSTALLMISQHG